VSFLLLFSKERERERERRGKKKLTQVSTCLQTLPLPSKVRIEVPVKESLGRRGPGMRPPPATVISIAHLEERKRKVRAFFFASSPRKKEKRPTNHPNSLSPRRQVPGGRLPDVEQHEGGGEDAAQGGDVEEVTLERVILDFFSKFFGFFFFSKGQKDEFSTLERSSKERENDNSRW